LLVSRARVDLEVEGNPSTWHYGITARWWAEFNTDGPEIAYFRPYVEAGQPALDVACGTGRLLLPYLRAGLDVDGCDVSADMLLHCRLAAEREGLAPNLYAQAMCELELPRRYRTVFVCGGFGLGSTRAQDVEALWRMHDQLEPGGTLVLDNEVPYANGRAWQAWPKEGRRELPRPRREPGERKVGSDGAEYALRTRLLDFDPLDQSGTWEMRAYMWRDGELVGEEEHRLTMRLYFRDELVLLLERAGFVDIDVRAGYTGAEPTADDDFLVFVARKPD
jgi:SAM-dependent methyltransferase